jgi:2-dehydro-3-deoxyphosphooctonate aldolase (KDO 8-P synthase)
MLTKEVKIEGVTVGGRSPLVLIAGPCVIESEGSALRAAERLKEIAKKIDIPCIFKSSYDKANRTSIGSYRGPGIGEGLRILEKVKRETSLPVTSDVHSVEEISQAAGVLDVIQVPAFLCRQTDLVVAAARSGKPVNIKKGQFLAPSDVKNIIEKVLSEGNENIIITERGVSFGYNNLVVDMRSIPIIHTFGFPVVFDATHSVQLPGGKGTASGGQREFVVPLARAAVAAGCDGVFLEVHECPEEALCDGPNMLDYDETFHMLRGLKDIHGTVRKHE